MSNNTNSFSIESLLIDAHGDKKSAENFKYQQADGSMESYNDIYAFEEAHAAVDLNMLNTYTSVESMNIKQHAKLLRRVANDFGKKSPSLTSQLKKSMMSLEADANEVGSTTSENGADKGTKVNVFKRMWAAICKFFKAILEKFKAFGRWVKNLFTKKIKPEDAANAVKVVGADPKPETMKQVAAMLKKNMPSGFEFKGKKIDVLPEGSYFSVKGFNPGKLIKGIEDTLGVVDKTIPLVNKIFELKADAERNKPIIDRINSDIEKLGGTIISNEIVKKATAVSNIKDIYSDVGLTVMTSTPKNIFDVTGSPEQFAAAISKTLQLNELESKISPVVKKIEDSMTITLKASDDGVTINNYKVLQKQMAGMRTALTLMSSLSMGVSKYISAIASLSENVAKQQKSIDDKNAKSDAKYQQDIDKRRKNAEKTA